MTIAEYADFDGLGLAELVRNKDVKPIELIDEAIARTEKLNPKLNFVVYRDFERARQTAKGPWPAGPFAGVPFYLKDIFAMAEGMPTRQATRFMPATPSQHDCLLTARYRSAGLVFLGQTHGPGFGPLPAPR